MNAAEKISEAPGPPINEALWARLKGWQQRDGRHLALWLERDPELNPGSGERLVEEYVRFLALCVSTGEALVPSTIVGEAWRVHAGYTLAYNDRFCPDVLGRTLHPMPVPGSPQLNPAHRRIASLYARAFGQPPPQDIWPDLPGSRLARSVPWVFGACTLLFLAGFGLGIILNARWPMLFCLASMAVPVWAAFRMPFPMERGEGRKDDS